MAVEQRQDLGQPSDRKDGTPVWTGRTDADKTIHARYARGETRVNIIIYTKSNCHNCFAAKQILASKNIDYLEVDIELGSRWENLLREFPDARQMPQIFINDQRVGGFAGLQAALAKLGL